MSLINILFRGLQKLQKSKFRPFFEIYISNLIGHDSPIQSNLISPFSNYDYSGSFNSHPFCDRSVSVTKQGNQIFKLNFALSAVSLILKHWTDADYRF